MHVHRRYVLHQGPVLAALARTAAVALKKDRKTSTETPGPTLTGSVGPRPEALVRDYIRSCGGSPSWYRGVVPAHMFPQWGFPLLSRTLVQIPYDMRKVLNGGCRIEVNHPIPAGERLHLSAELASIDDNGRRAVLQQRLVTGTDTVPDAVVSTLYAIVPLRKKGDPKGPKKERARVPADAREIARLSLKPKHAVDFALLTGDFNPVHISATYARAAGFRSTILHGFATLGMALEAVNRNVWSGDPRRLRTVDVKFTRPLVLPRRVGVFLADDGALFVGDNPGGPAYLTGSLESRPPHEETL